MSKNNNSPEKLFSKRNHTPHRIPLCHQLPERTIYIKNKPLPLCARCTGVLLGTFTLPFFHWSILNPSYIHIILLGLPATIDAISQYMGWRESNNLLRLITGFLLGFGIAYLIVIAGKGLAGIIINIT